MRQAAHPTIRQAVVLVGGLGTRLGELTAATPKPLLNCGDRPFLAWLLRELCRFGVEEVLLLTGHLADTVEAALPAISASLPRPLRIACVREKQQAGTGGALFRPTIIWPNGSCFVTAIRGWISISAACWPTPRTTRKMSSDAWSCAVWTTPRGMALPKPKATGSPDSASGQRPGQPGTINAGMYLLDRRVLDAATPVCSLERDILPKLAAKGVLRGTVADGYFIDIGIPVDLARAQTELPVRLRRRALFLDRDVVIISTTMGSAHASISNSCPAHCRPSGRRRTRVGMSSS